MLGVVLVKVTAIPDEAVAEAVEVAPTETVVGAKLTAPTASKPRLTRAQLGGELFRLAAYAQSQGWSAEDLLQKESRKQERAWRKREKGAAKAPA